MIISEQWLREWVSPAINTEDLAHQLTMAGLEVDAVDPVAPVEETHGQGGADKPGDAGDHDVHRYVFPELMRDC